MDLAAPLAVNHLVALVDDIKDFFRHIQREDERRWVSRTNCSRLTASARFCGESAVAQNARSSFCSGQSALSNLNIIFRRCANDRFTIFTNASRSLSASNGRPRRTKATHAESTSGEGKKQVAGILNQPRDS